MGGGRPPGLSRGSGAPVHLVHGYCAAGSRGEGLRGRCLVLTDSVSEGPCHPAHEAHAVLRRAHWVSAIRLHRPESLRRLQRSLREDVLGAAELVRELRGIPEREAVVIWSTRSWSDQIELWWVLDALEGSGLDLRRFRVAELRGRWESLGMGCFTPQQFREALPGARPLGAEFLREGERLWRLYASDRPAGFDAARRRGSTRFPALRTCAEAWGWAFPRPARARGRFLVNEIDEALLGLNSRRRWTTGAAVVGEFLARHGFLCRGDWTTFVRLLEWAQHRPWGPALEVKFEPARAGLGRYSFRLTAEGERILREGLAEPWEAPPFWAGGTQVYADPPWLKRARGRSWRIERP